MHCVIPHHMLIWMAKLCCANSACPHLSQDPLEKFFGCQRMRGGTHDNPSVQEFCKNTQALRSLTRFAEGQLKETVEEIANP